MKDKLERLVTILPAWDKRHKNPSKNYGVHCCDLRMVLKGPKGAVQFILYTGWDLPHVTEEYGVREPMPADLGYHSPTPMWEDQTPMDNCPYLDGKPCYYDGSSLNAERIYRVLLEKGSDGVWAELEEYYNDTFGGNK